MRCKSKEKERERTQTKWYKSGKKNWTNKETPLLAQTTGPESGEDLEITGAAVTESNCEIAGSNHIFKWIHW